MLRKILVIVNAVSCLLFIYGICNHLILMESNSCEMTYMFQLPQYRKIHVTSNKFYSKYGLYYYTEGYMKTNIQGLNGAPVLFLPGNGGSYKQVRSLASVALRMGSQSKENLHLDYFSIDYGEELSAFFGGYLEKQKDFLRMSIRAIERIYKKYLDKPFNLVIVGHSMGGTVAKSLLSEKDLAKHIAAIIFLSTPLDQPVINIDCSMNRFYEKTNKTLQEKRRTFNLCNGFIKEGDIAVRKEMKDEVLLVSIGGGNRDLQVPSWLTTSPHSNIHVMTSAIPNVWLSCDHLSIVWCLQLMKVVNKFLFSIVQRQPNDYVIFQRDFQSNFISAYKYFVGSSYHALETDHFDYQNDSLNNELWYLEENRQHFKTFQNGLEKTYNHLIPLNNHGIEEKMYIEVSNAEVNDWLHGCIAERMRMGVPTCKRIFPLANQVSSIPVETGKKSYALLDIQTIVNAHSDWTHILVRLPTTRKSISLQCDIYNPSERDVHLKAPALFSFAKEDAISTSFTGAVYTRLVIENVNFPYLALQLHIRKIDCSSEQSDITIKTGASWAKGFDEYHIVHASEQEKYVIVNPPVDKSASNDSLQKYVYVDIYQYPSSRLVVNQYISFKHSMRRIAQRFNTYIPTHMTAVLITLLAQNCFHKKVSDTNIFRNAFKEAFQFESIFVAVACHLLQDYSQNGTMRDSLTQILITVLLQGTAIIMNTLFSLCLCAFLVLGARTLMVTLPTMNNILQLLHFPNIPAMLSPWLIIGIIILSITLVTCCSMGMLLTCLVYFMWLSNIYRGILLKQYQFSKLSEFEGIYLNIRNQYNYLLPHLKLLQLLLLITSLNVGEIIAFVINYPSSRQIFSFNPQWISNILLLISWTLLWETEDLVYLYNYKIVSLLLYSIAMTCFLYSQQNVYTLNYVVTSVYFLLLLFNSLQRFVKYWKY